MRSKSINNNDYIINDPSSHSVSGALFPFEVTPINIIVFFSILVLSAFLLRVLLRRFTEENLILLGQQKAPLVLIGLYIYLIILSTFFYPFFLLVLSLLFIYIFWFFVTVPKFRVCAGAMIHTVQKAFLEYTDGLYTAQLLAIRPDYKQACNPKKEELDLAYNCFVFMLLTLFACLSYLISMDPWNLKIYWSFVSFFSLWAAFFSFKNYWTGAASSFWTYSNMLVFFHWSIFFLTALAIRSNNYYYIFLLTFFHAAMTFSMGRVLFQDKHLAYSLSYEKNYEKLNGLSQPLKWDVKLTHFSLLAFTYYENNPLFRYFENALSISFGLLIYTLIFPHEPTFVTGWWFAMSLYSLVLTPTFLLFRNQRRKKKNKENGLSEIIAACGSESIKPVIGNPGSIIEQAVKNKWVGFFAGAALTTTTTAVVISTMHDRGMKRSLYRTGIEFDRLKEKYPKEVNMTDYHDILKIQTKSLDNLNVFTHSPWETRSRSTAPIINQYISASKEDIRAAITSAAPSAPPAPVTPEQTKKPLFLK